MVDVVDVDCRNLNSGGKKGANLGKITVFGVGYENFCPMVYLWC